MIGRELAARTIARHGTSDLDTIVKAEGLRVETRYPWRARFDDILVYPLILIPRGLSPAQYRTRIAHSLGHHLLHDGNQAWLRGFDRIWSWKQEYQAEEFAAWLTIPESEDVELAYMSVGEAARRYRVDEKLADIRLRYREEPEDGFVGMQGRLV